MNINIKKIFGRGASKVLALEIGQECIKAAVSEEKGGSYRLVGLVATKITDSSEAAVAGAVKKLIAEQQLTNFNLVVSLPRHSVTLRYMKLPSADPAEIESMANLQAVKQLPYPKDDLIIAYAVLNTDAQGYSGVSLIVAHKDVVGKYLNILKAVGLEPQLMALSTEAVGRYFNLTGGEARAGANTAVTVIDVDLAFTEIQVHFNNKVIFSRSLNQGIRDFDDPNKRKTWIDDIKLSLSTYVRESGLARVTAAALTGSAWRREGMDKVFSGELNMPVGIIYPLKVGNVSAETESRFGRAGYLVSLSSVIALALDHSRFEVNLLPSQVKISQKKTVQLRKLIKIAVCAACFILALSFLVGKKINDKKTYLGLLKERLETIAPEAEELNKKAKMARMVKEHLKPEGSCLDIIREAYALIPQNIHLTRLVYDGTKAVTLKGSSPNMSGVFKFVTVLEGSEYFENVQLRYASKRKAKGADLTDFEVYAPLR